MPGVFNVLLGLLLIGGIHCQRNDERDFPPERIGAGRAAKTTFDTQFVRGRCPNQFYQLGDECVYFSPNGKVYSWEQAEHACARRVGALLDLPGSGNLNQPNMKPTKGVRQLVLNTPEKTQILRALYQEYSEQNYAVRLPGDYNTLRRCTDGQDDKWPHYCTSNVSPNATCFEAVSNSPTDSCIREISCTDKYSRLACEFTLPGSAELTSSKFRHCPKVRPRLRRLPFWVWILIAVGGAILALIILGTIIGLVRKSKKNSPPKKKPFPEPRAGDDTVVRVTTTRADPAAEPMLVRASPTPADDSGYLQPRVPDRRLPPAVPRTTDGSTNA